MGVVSSAHAVTTWSGHLPAKNAVLTARPVNGSVVAQSNVPFLKYTGQFVVDGVPRATTILTSGTYKATFIASYQTAVGEDGTHTVVASITDKLGAVQAETWQFKTAIPPTLGVPTPAAGSLLTTTNPTISFPVSDNSMVALWDITVNGQTALGTLSAGRITIVLPESLNDDAVNTISATIYDGIGLAATRTWSYNVQVSPEMAEIACGDCHTDKDFPEHTYNTDCLDCHYTSPHTGAPSAYHPTANVTACRPCHVSAITVEHQKYGLTCETCHLSADAAVQTAIVNNQTECESCHPGAAGHEAQHVTTVPPTCAGASCHDAASLTELHINSGTTLNCASCHSSSDTAVIEAIATGNKDCSACHAMDAHMTVHETTVPVTCSGAECHVENNLTTLHSVPGCDGCHSSTDPDVIDAIATGDKDCSACHAMDAHVTVHETTVPTTCAGTGCHVGTNLTTLHSVPGCDGCHASTDPDVVNAIATNNKDCSACHGSDMHVTPLHDTVTSVACDGSGCHSGTNLTAIHATSGCAGCHTSVDPDVTGAITAGTKTCEACHNEDGVDYHSGAAAAHTSPTTAGCFGAGCHDVSQSLPTVHALYAGPGTANPEFANTCELCHSNPAVDVSTSGASCTPACHSGTTHSGYHDGHAVTTASATCTACHGEDIVVTHNVALPDATRCGVCHGDPANFSKTADCASCHSSVDHETQHVITPDPVCGGCHEGTSLTTIHSVPGCAGCHDSVDPNVIAAISTGDKSCAACHGAEPHADLDVAHTANLTSENMAVLYDHFDYPVVVYDVPCTMCHASSVLTTIHAQDCASCHGGANPPTESFGDWNKTCSQGDCHVAVTHNTGPESHNAMLNSGAVCESCHDPDDWSVPWQSCYNCHDTSTNGAPVTTSNAANSYVGSATITLSSPGIAYTFFKVDGGATTAGTSIYVEGPATGTASHTIEFWSVDDYGMEELPHKTKTFTISAP